MTRSSPARKRNKPAKSPFNAVPAWPSADNAFPIFLRMRWAVDASSRRRSPSTDALYSTRTPANPLPQLCRGENGIVLVSQTVESDLVVRVLGQVRLQSLLDEIGLRPIGRSRELLEGLGGAIWKPASNRTGHRLA